jgi:hypothetical protein
MKRVVTWLLIGHVSILFSTARAAMLLPVQIELLFVTKVTNLPNSNYEKGER